MLEVACTPVREYRCALTQRALWRGFLNEFYLPQISRITTDYEQNVSVVICVLCGKEFTHFVFFCYFLLEVACTPVREYRCALTQRALWRGFLNEFYLPQISRITTDYEQNVSVVICVLCGKEFTHFVFFCYFLLEVACTPVREYRCALTQRALWRGFLNEFYLPQISRITTDYEQNVSVVICVLCGKEFTHFVFFCYFLLEVACTPVREYRCA